VVTVQGPIDPASGLAIDFGELKVIVQREVIDRLDHKNLNDIIENPTAERISVWIWERLSSALVGVEEIELFETRSCSVVYRGE
jgi:6-pyruvoyltetrahydropterin/6-carboxytetrahydropterin synthase